MKKRTMLYLAAAILISLAIAALVFKNSGQEVAAVQVRQGSIMRTVSDTGYVQAAVSYDIHATQNARVLRVPVKVGQTVKQGQTLVVLENLDLALQISDMRSQLSQARTAAEGSMAALERIQLEQKDAAENFDRLQRLYQEGAANRVDYDKARLQVETIRQNMEEQKSKLNSALEQSAGFEQSLQQLNTKEQQLVVKTPVKGTVLELPVKQEQVLNSGDLLAGVAVAEQLEVKADILSDDLAEVKVGQKVDITAPVLGQKVLLGEVKQIYPSAEEKQSALGIIQRRVPVIIALSDRANLKPGYEVRAAIRTITRQDVLVLPKEAVITNGDDRKEVMVVVDNHVQHRVIQTGISDNENIEITSGLVAGEQVIKDGSLDLQDKTRVKVVA
jgi:HlyD family secretion protein